MLNIILHGCNGKMGKTLQKIIAQDSELSVIAGIDLNMSSEILEERIREIVIKKYPEYDCVITVDESYAPVIK